ncbi:MAG: hypothetical protein ACREQ9_26400 [Candidatus Binatia bacterium]
MPFRSSILPFVLVVVPLTVAADAAARGRDEANPPPHARFAPRSDPWGELRPQMTKGEVLRLLGVPPWMERSLLFEFWMYEVQSTLASGVIVFEKERVFSWRPPSEVRRSR